MTRLFVEQPTQLDGTNAQITESGLQANSPALGLGLHIQLVGAASIRSAAYFEVRTKRLWWAPWRKRKVWTQVSSWHMNGPPAGAEIVTVDDVAALPGRVHTIGRVSGTGGVEYKRAGAGRL